jgi:putative inorganic carbon (hco3(-)) transporter
VVLSSRTLPVPSLRPGFIRDAFLTLGVATAVTFAGLVAASRPSSTLVAAATLLIVGVALLRIDIAILLVVAMGPLEGAITTSVGGLSMTKALGALCFASFAFNVLRTRAPIRFDRSHLAVLLILGIAMVSMLQARDQAAAVQTTVRYASFAAFFIVLAQFGSERWVQRRVAWVLTTAATIAAILGLQRYFGNNSYAATLKLSSTNDFAFALATAMPFAFWLLGTHKVLRPLVVTMIALMSAAIVLSLSRGTLLGVGAGILFVLLTDRRRFRLILGGGLVAVVATVLIIHSDPARFQTAVFGKQKVADYNVATRLDAWRAAVDLASTHPLLGIGPGNFQAYFFEASEIPPGSTNLKVVHDAYLDIAAELGVLAAVAFLLYIGVTFARLTTAYRDNIGPPGYAQALRVSLVIAALSSVFVSEQYFLPFWLIGGLATALWSERAEAPEPEAAPAAVAPPRAERAADYDQQVPTTRAVEERERRLSAQFAAVRVQQDQLLARRRMLDEREHELEARLTRLASVDAELARRETEVRTREADEAERTPAFVGREADIVAREAEQAARAAGLNEQAKELERLAHSAESSRRAIEKTEQAVAARTEALWQRERELAEAQARADARHREAESAERRAARQAKQLAQQLQLLQKRDADLDRRAAELVEHERTAAEDRKELQADERRLARLTDQLERRAASLERHETDVARRLERVMTREEALKSRENEVVARNRAFEAATKDLDAREHRLASAARALEARELALERREAQLGRSRDSGTSPPSG